MSTVTHGIATFFWTGHLRPAPGTWGSAAALPAAWVIGTYTGWAGFLVAILLVVALGFWATAEEIRGKAEKDPSEIVIDEVAGQWIALFPVIYGASAMGTDLLRLYPGWIVGFLFFRLFDIWKPWLVGWADRREGAMGVMLDDVIAGVFAALVVIASAGIAHGFLM